MHPIPTPILRTRGLAVPSRGLPAPPPRPAMAVSRVSPQSVRAVPPRATRAAKITGIYIGLVGLALFVAPESCFSLLFDPQELRAIWIRVFGILCAVLGWYYYGAARDSVLAKAVFLSLDFSG